MLLEYDYLKAYPELRFMETPMYANELSSIAYSPRDPNHIIINIKRFQLILLDVRNCKSKMIDMSVIKTSDRPYVTHARFSYDGKFLVSCESHYMHVWEANIEMPKFIATVNIHSIDRFPISINKDSNLIATGSTLHTAIKVWNLDNIYTCSGAQIKVYENPLEIITCSSGLRLIFVKISHGTKLEYKFIDYFGIEVWNMNTGGSTSCLPIGRYGQLLQMEASQDGQLMAMLINNRDENYVVLVNFKLNKILHTFNHSGAIKFVVSPKWDYIATEAIKQGTHDIKLWSCKSGEVAHFLWASDPVFTMDRTQLLYCLNYNCVEVFSLKTLSGVNSIICDADTIGAIPSHAQMVMVTKFPEKPKSAVPPRFGSNPGASPEAQVSIWHINAGLLISQFSHVAPGGVRDISKDGRIFIDGFLQVMIFSVAAILCGI